MKSQPVNPGLKNFLQFQNKVMKFFAYYIDIENNNDVVYFYINYYLEDDTVEL